MHIPDHYLSPETCVVLGAAMLPIWVLSAKKIKRDFPKENLPLLGAFTAISFLIMMFNVPLPGGTTGHAVGGVLIGIIFGPHAACISVSAALLIQALVFGDGGIFAFGANCFNMAFIMPFAGCYIYQFIEEKFKSEKVRYAGIAFSSYIGLNLAAFCAAVEFGVQPQLFTNTVGQPMYCPYPLSVSIPAMTIPHLAIAGVIEAVFTVVVITYFKIFSPSLFDKSKELKLRPAYALITILLCLSPIGLLATGTAWGEWGVSEIKNVIVNGSMLGYIPEGMKHGFVFKSVFPDYSINGMPDIAAYLMSGILGIFTFLSFQIISFKKSKSTKNS